MPFATRLPCLFALSFASAPAQTPETPPNPDAQLLLDLGNAERSVDVVRTLTHRGAAGVNTLMAAIRDPWFHADERRLASAIYALGKLGDLAAPAAPLLLEELRKADGDVLRNLYWAIGEIGPKAESLGQVVLEPLKSLKPSPGYAHQEWVFACRRIELGTDLSQEQFGAFLRARDQASQIAVAALLCRLPVGSPVPREDLLNAWAHGDRDWQLYGEGYKRVGLEIARAVALHAPDAPEAAAAREALIFHFDVEVRQQAVMQIGQNPGHDLEAAVKALQLALTDGSVHVRREAVTALGMIGPPAGDALPALQKLATDPDPQIRGRVPAAMRAIDRKVK